MPAYRYFHADKFKENEQVALEGLEFQHLGKVMRGKPGDVVELVNGVGELAQGEISELGKRKAILQVIGVNRRDKPERQLVLAQASPKMNRLEFILEKGTELGATEFRIFPGTHSEKKEYSENQLERLRNITIAAMKQSGRLFLPTIVLMPALQKWKELQLPAYFGDVSENAPRLLDAVKKDSALIFIGPEAGFTKQEEAKMQDLGALGVKLHNNILRTDTAAIAALAILTA